MEAGLYTVSILYSYNFVVTALFLYIYISPIFSRELVMRACARTTILSVCICTCICMRVHMYSCLFDHVLDQVVKRIVDIVSFSLVAAYILFSTPLYSCPIKHRTLRRKKEKLRIGCADPSCCIMASKICASLKSGILTKTAQEASHRHVKNLNALFTLRLVFYILGSYPHLSSRKRKGLARACRRNTPSQPIGSIAFSLSSQENTCV